MAKKTNFNAMQNLFDYMEISADETKAEQRHDTDLKITKQPEQDKSQDIAVEKENSKFKESVKPKTLEVEELTEDESVKVKPEELVSNSEETTNITPAQKSKQDAEISVPSNLSGTSEFVQCGTSLSKRNDFYIKKTAIQNGVNVNTRLANILQEYYLVSTPITEQDVLAMEDDYYNNQRTNIKKTFILPKYLKDFLNTTAMEAGIKIAVLLNHYIDLKRTAENNCQK